MSYVKLFSASAAGLAMTGIVSVTQAQDIPTASSCAPIKFESAVCNPETNEPTALFSTCSTVIVSMAFINRQTGESFLMSTSEEVRNYFTQTGPNIRSLQESQGQHLAEEDRRELENSLTALQKARENGLCDGPPMF
jgi:hypothetical protein